MKAVHPYLLFKGNAAEAFRFYEQVFRSEVTSRTSYEELGMSMSDDDAGMLANISLPIAPGVSLMASDVSEAMDPGLRIGGNVQITLVPDDADEAYRVFAALSEGGTVRQELTQTVFAELYGETVDRFGTSWIVIIEDDQAMG